MRFQRQSRYEFQDTPRKRAAFFTKQRRERESLPELFLEDESSSMMQTGTAIIVRKAIGTLVAT